MSCDAVALSAALWLAAASPAPAPATLVAISAPVQAPLSVAGEPLFADIIKRAAALRAEVAAYRQGAGTGPLPDFTGFSSRIAALADLDMKGHVTLKERGTDGDLKCILRGISQDLPLKLKDVADAPAGKARDNALRDMDYLLRDNVEVITAPPAPAV